MPSALIDTGVLLDYLRGDARARRAVEPYAHRSISVVTWLEVMQHCPPDLLERTRGFLRTFERLSISEAIADEALRLMQDRPGLTLPGALTWASAQVNRLPFVTADLGEPHAADAPVVVAYRRAEGLPIPHHPAHVAAQAARRRRGTP